jgi:pimeloyl-ACP methyl ester carboxylesterase
MARANVPFPEVPFVKWRIAKTRAASMALPCYRIAPDPHPEGHQMKTPILAAAAALLAGQAVPAKAVDKAVESISATTSYHRASVDGVGIFYREAGPKDAPTIVLLHGFPSSSREFDTLIPLLATRYHLIAPDFPGFGHSDAPPPSVYTYTFDHLAETTDHFLTQLHVEKCAFFLHDYGGPIGFRILLAHPERARALIVSNANSYTEGLGPKWATIAKYWSDRAAHPEVFDAFVSRAATEQRHTLGTSHPERYNPDTWTDEYAFLSRGGQREIQADLLYDYRTNVAAYPAWQAWLRDHKPPTLVVWGRNDPSFIAPGADAYKRDVPDAEVHLLDAGHFALDEKNDEIATLILQFLSRQGY